MKKLLVLLLALAMVLTLVACGNEPEPTPSTEPAPSTQPKTEPTTEPQPSEDPAAGYPMDPEELGSGTVKWSEETTADGWILVTNEDGTTLGYSPDSGLKLIQVDGYAFKDLNKNGKLDAYEDWRLSDAQRSADIASMLTVEDVAGLMLFSSHEFNVSAELTEAQTTYLDQGLRAVLNAATTTPDVVQAEWANSMQAYAEGTTLGIPVNFSSDPRPFNFPGNLALAATFEPDLALQQGQYLSRMYRAIGIGTLLGPQIDLATEPRWARVSGTFGEDPALSRDMAAANVIGYQSTYVDGVNIGWGPDSVNAMVKHWPSDGAGQAGRESHNHWGQYTVYPGGQFETALIPFVDGALNLGGEVSSATAIMSSYSIAWSDTEEYGELVGSAFSEYKNQLLRAYGYDGIICTDWGVTYGTIWGVEELTEAERCMKAIMAGTDQFGGLNDPTNILAAYDLMVADMGADAALARFQESGDRLLKNYFTIGLFDNPYVDTSVVDSIINNPDAIATGREASLKSIVMLKNSGNAIKAATEEKLTVYVPLNYTPTAEGSSGSPPTYATANLPINEDILKQYFNVVTDEISDVWTGPADEEGNPTLAESDIIRASADVVGACDLALVFVESPNNGGYNGGYDSETGEYLPISLQYREYVADSEYVRQESIAAPMTQVEIYTPYGIQYDYEKGNLSYYGKSYTVSNSNQLDMILDVADRAGDTCSVVVCLNASNATVMAEFESEVDAILVGFSVDNALFLEIASGNFEPYGLLPIQMPASMEAVEAQYEDVPRDLECHVDAEGNTYDFAFGMNWSGVINDERVATYSVPALVTPEAQPAK